MAFPTHASTTASTVDTAGTSHTVDYPGTVNDGDHLFLIFSFHGAVINATVSTPTGWTLIDTVYRTGFNGRMGFYHRHADGTEGASFTVTTSGNAKSVSQVIRVTGGYDSPTEGTSWDVSATIGDFDTTIDPAEVTATWGSNDNLFLMLCAYGASNETVTTWPTSYSTLQTTSQQNSGAQNCTAVSASRQLGAASDNPSVMTITGSENSGVVTVAVRPSSGASVVPVRAELTPVARVPTIRQAIDLVPVRAELRPVARIPIIPRVVPPPFPEGNLDLLLEAAFGAGDTNPMTWDYTNLSGRLLDESAFTITRGRADEAAETDPSTIAPIIDNTDGALTPWNPSSPYWPNVVRGTPLRVSIGGATPALLLPGLSGANASTPDHPDFDFAGTFDIRVLLEPDAWSSVPQYSGQAQIVNADPQPLVSRWDAGDLSWLWSIAADAQPRFEWSTNGTAVSALSTYRHVAALGPIWLAAQFEPDNGSIGHTITWYRYDQGLVAPTDLAEWTVINAVDVDGTTSVNTGASGIEIGGYIGGALRGRILQVEIRDAGTLVANPDFTAQEIGDRVFVDGTGKTWTVNGAAEISTRQARMTGRLDEVKPLWPYGDHNRNSTAASESRAALVASGLLRRLQQGEKPLRSTLRRHVEQVRYKPNVLSYWPCEDSEAATGFSSAFEGEPAMAMSNLKLANDSTLLASAPLPTIENDVDGWFRGSVPPPAAAADNWRIDWVMYIKTPETSPTSTRIMAFTTAGTARQWYVDINSVNMIVTVYDADGGELESNTTGVNAADVFDQWVLVSLEASQAGANISWTWTIVELETGGAGSQTDSFAGTIGNIGEIRVDTTGPPDGMSFGHIIVSTGGLATGWLAGADTAWVGESAAHRFFRLCMEQGIPAEVIGEPTVNDTSTALFRGDLALSEPMGPQRQEPFTELLFQCAQVDLGQIIERRAAPGLVYRTRGTLENQVPAIELDGATNGQIINPFEPVLDDQRLRNDVTVESVDGTSSRVIDQDSIDLEGLYDEELKIPGVGGVRVQDTIVAVQDGLAEAIRNQNLLLAGWRLHLGTTGDMRYPTVSIDLGAAPEAIADWQGVNLGDRVTVINLPEQHPGRTVELIVEAIAEEVSYINWIVTLTCSPGAPWLVGILDE